MKIWEQVFTDIDPSGAVNLNGLITIPAGEKALLQIPFPYEARIGKIVCKQVSPARGGGTAVAFSLTVYSTAVIPVGTSVTALPDNAPLYEAVPVRTAIAGAAIRDFTPDTGGDGLLFRNYNGNQTNPERFCYVLILPTAAGTITKWELAIMSVVDI